MTFNQMQLQTTAYVDTFYGQLTTQTRLQSETADSITWGRYSRAGATEVRPTRVIDALTRIEFMELPTPTPLHAIAERADALGTRAAKDERNLVVVVGRSRRLAVEDHQKELKELVEKHGGIANEVRKTAGDVATALVVSGCSASLVVLQAASRLAESD